MDKDCNIMEFFKIVDVQRYKPNGRAFRKWRKERDLTTKQAATFFDISQSYYSQIENNTIERISKKQVKKIRKALGV